MTDASIDISFVVPAYNEARLIGDTLASLHEAGASVGGSYEIVVADDASEDATAAIARDQGARVVSVRHRQIAATRNAGARESRGALIIFVDADTRVPAPTVHATMGAVRHGVVAGGLPLRVRRADTRLGEARGARRDVAVAQGAPDAGCVPVLHPSRVRRGRRIRRVRASAARR